MSDRKRQYEITTGASYFYMPGEKVCLYSNIELETEVDGKALKQAAELLLRRFPYAAVRPQVSEEGDRYILVENEKPFPLTQKKGFIELFTPEAKDYLFTIAYDGKHMYVEAFHGLVDGMGFVILVKALIKAYFEQLDGRNYSCSDVKNVWDAPDDADTVDPYSVPVSMDHPFTYKKHPGFSFSDDQIDPDDTRLYSFSVPEKELVEYAKKYEGGVSGAISLALARAIDFIESENQLPVNIACPNNIRSMLGCSDTLFNCTKSATYTHSTRLRSMSYDQQLSILKGQMMIQCSAEYQVPRFLQDKVELEELNSLRTVQAKKDSFSEMKLKSTPIVSYLGKFDMDELNERISSIGIYSKVMGRAGMQSLCTCFKGRCYLQTSYNLKSDKYIRMFANEMREFSYECSEITLTEY